MKITEKVIKIECTKGAYCYAVMDDGVTLIDTSLPKMGDKIMNELKANRVKPTEIKSILLTHDDIDHIGNVAYFQKLCGCQVWISEEDYPKAMGQRKRHGIKGVIGTFMKVDLPQHLSYIKTDKIGRIEAIPTPGHTSGHMCYRFENVMFVGDLMRSKRGKLGMSPNIMNWSKEKLVESLKGLSLDGVEWLCPAHGEPVLVKSAWDDFLNEINAR